MDKKFFIELTNDLYRLTILFPDEEPIRIKMRSLADDILSDLITILEGASDEKLEAAKKIEKNIGILEGMIEIARDQKWVKEDDFKDVKENYLEIKDEIKKFNKMQKSQKETKRPLTKTKPEPEPPKQNVTSLNNRQKKILEMLEKNAKVQVQDVINELDKKVTKRTIRRDFKRLVKMGFAVKKGRANTTHYKLKE